MLAPVLLGVLAVVPGPAHAAADDPVPSRTLFTIDDDEVFESSGLVDTGRVVYTINDSGDDAVVYGLDPGSGRPVSRTTYADSVEDVEAIAPGRDGRVWVGDIGDNRRRRDDVTVYRVDPRDGEHPGTAHRLTYPDGAHDAETLLVHPRTGRVFVVSKSPFGGTVYAAPRTLSGARDRPAHVVRAGLRAGHRRHVLPRREAGAAAHLRHRVGLHLPRLRARRHGAAARPAAGRGHLGLAAGARAGLQRGPARRRARR